MITVTIEKRYGAATVLRARVSAPTIEPAVELADSYGEGGGRVGFPIDGETFRAPVGEAGEGIGLESLTLDEPEAAHEVGLPGAYEAYALDALRNDMGPDALSGLRPREPPRLAPEGIIRPRRSQAHPKGV